MSRWKRLLTDGLVAATLVAATALPAGASVADREDLDIVVKPREPRPDVFVLKGRVKPAYAEKHAILQRRNCGGCAWFAFERFRTDDASSFRLGVPTPGPGETRRICYRVKISRSADYRRAISASHCIGGVDPSAD